MYVYLILKDKHVFSIVNFKTFLVFCRYFTWPFCQLTTPELKYLKSSLITAMQLIWRRSICTAMAEESLINLMIKTVSDKVVHENQKSSKIEKIQSCEILMPLKGIVNQPHFSDNSVFTYLVKIVLFYEKCFANTFVFISIHYIMSVTVPCCKTNFTKSKHIMLSCTLSWLFYKCCLVVV